MLKSGAVILASAGGFIESLGPTWRGIAALGAALCVGFTGGVSVVMAAGPYRGLPDRTSALEVRMDDHEADVAEPGIARIQALEHRADRMSEDLGMVREMVFQLYCLEFPTRCEGVPR